MLFSRGLDFSKTKRERTLSHYKGTVSHIETKSTFKDSNHIDTVKPRTLLGFVDGDGEFISFDDYYGRNKENIETMDYGTIYANVCADLLLITDEFDIAKVMQIACERCSESFTKEEVKELALRALDDLLDIGMVRIEQLDDEVLTITYRTELAPEKDASEEKLQGLEPGEKE